eukprot:COSAG05_NODE_5171_length_1245_cov_1.628272_1_plen_119_part_00
MQQRFQPYADVEANHLKSMVDVQIFVTFLICFSVRVLPTIHAFEPLDATVYGYILVGSLAVVILNAVGLVAKQVFRRRRFRVGLMSTAQQEFELASSISSTRGQTTVLETLRELWDWN